MASRPKQRRTSSKPHDPAPSTRLSSSAEARDKDIYSGIDSNRPSKIEEDIPRLSKMVYIGLCQKLGTPKVVKIRRDVVDIKDKVDILAQAGGCYKNIKRLGGSSREGFRLDSSDVDSMFWKTDHRVIWESAQSQKYNPNRQTLILCDCTDSPPGYTLLYLLAPSLNKRIKRSCVSMKNREYISSSKYRQNICSAFPFSPIEHGPCASGIQGDLEFDNAHGFICDFWPPSANSWRERCHTWPQSKIVNDIVTNGCHFVAVGHKRSKHEHNEWRISFSVAEHELVRAMNHCQFLTYGLLKLFLTEIINDGISIEDKLLSSYHMKTAVFWVIQQNVIPHWCPENLLECFWVCFKHVLKWVYEGVCPNIFIPENNMFLASIYGYGQNVLFIELHRLYEKGLESLLPIRFFERCNNIILRNPEARIITDGQIVEHEVDVELFQEINKENSLPPSNLRGYMRYLHTIEHMIGSQFLKKHEVIMLQTLTANVFQSTAFLLHMMNCTNGNKKKYGYDKIACYLLKLAAKFGCISDILYLAMYYYKTLRYSEVLSLIEKTKVKNKLKQPYMIMSYIFPEKYSETLGGMSWAMKLKRAVAWDIKIYNYIQYISELVLEQQSGLQTFEYTFCIPPFVLLYLLEILCYKHVDPIKAQLGLHALRTLVNTDSDRFVEYGDRDISWQILGISQQITGDYQAAIKSYQESLRYQGNGIRAATLVRIIILIYRLYIQGC